MMFGRTVIASSVMVAMFVAVFSMGAATGAEIAQNQSATVAEEIAELEQSMQKGKAQIRENRTGWKQTATLAVWNSMVPPAMAFTKMGLRLGANYPTFGAVMQYLGPVAMLGVVVAGSWSYLKRLYRGVRW